ncbi:hypothetical protein ACFL3Q_03885 [Planctomycetota bacterium]
MSKNPPPYSIVDESHTTWTKKVMDELLNEENENHLDTDWTLENKNNERTQTEEERLDPLSSISPHLTSTYNKANKSG